MKKIIINILSITVLLSISLHSTMAQNKGKEIDFIFQKLKNGIEKAEVSEFSNYFNSRIYISLDENNTGYFSSNQAFYVLTDFFENNKVHSFSFKQKISKGDNPYAYGELDYISNNKRGTLKVFISLEYIFTDWKITQITIN